MADQYTPTPVKTKTAGDIISKIVDTAGVNELVVEADGSINVNASFGGGTGDINLVEVAGTPVSVNSGTADAGTIRVAPATDVIHRVSKDGSANAQANPIWSRLTDGTNPLGTAANPLVVSEEGASGAPVDSGLLTSVALAAGASIEFDSANIAGGTTGRLLEITASASVRLKVEAGTWDGATFTPERVFFVDANEAWSYAPRDRDTITFPGAATATFRLQITNMDNTLAADVYGSITHEAV